MTPTVSEIIAKIDKEPSKKKKLEIAREHGSVAGFTQILAYTYDPRSKFIWDDLPPYNENAKPAGEGPMTLNTEHRMLQYFQKDICPVEIPLHKKEQMLIQTLEALEKNEAELVKHIFKGKLPAKGLTAKFVDEAFPGFLFHEQNHPQTEEPEAPGEGDEKED